ncbi:MAG: exosortase C-terminal domain/associated protein EpsI [bacterium]
METKKNYTIVIVLLSVALLIIIFLSLPSPPIRETNLKHFPKIIGEWKGEDYPIEERVYKMLRKSDLLLRAYTNTKGDTVLLFIVASSVNPEAFHPPEICLTGGGTQFLKKEIVQIQINQGKIGCNKLYIKEKDAELLTIYWFRVGKRNTHSYYIQQLNIVFDQIRRKDSVAAMIRISSLVEKGKIDNIVTLEENFIKEISPLLDKYLMMGTNIP